MLNKFIIISTGLFSIFSISTSAQEYIFATEHFNTINATQCFYEESSGAPKTINFQGLLGHGVPQHYQGLTLQDNSRVIDGWAPTWSSCSSTTDSHDIVTYGNAIPVVDFIVIENPTWKGGMNRVNLIANASDYEGNIVSYEWEVNGQVQSSTSDQITIRTLLGGDYTVTVRATDGGVRIKNTQGNYYYNAGYPTFEQTGIITRDITLQEWYCDGNCTIH